MTNLAKPPTTLTVAGLGLPLTKAEIDAEHAADRPTLREFAMGRAVADDTALAALDADLSAVVTLRDELVARRQGPVQQIKALIGEWEAWFRPYLKDIDEAVSALKESKARYLTAKDAAARKAREDAQKAADEGRSADVLPAIQLAQSLAAAPAGTRYAWEATVINFAMLPDEYKIADQARLDLIAKGMGSADEQTQFIPGVKFARVAVVQARKNK
jgi:hypothetical protein